VTGKKSDDHEKKLGWLKRNALLVALLWTGHIAVMLESVAGYARSTYNKDVDTDIIKLLREKKHDV
jgi:hypothetical protein